MVVQRCRKDDREVRMLDSLKLLELTLNIGDFLATWGMIELQIQLQTTLETLP